MRLHILCAQSELRCRNGVNELSFNKQRCAVTGETMSETCIIPFAIDQADGSLDKNMSKIRRHSVARHLYSQKSVPSRT